MTDMQIRAKMHGGFEDAVDRIVKFRVGRYPDAECFQKKSTEHCFLA